MLERVDMKNDPAIGRIARLHVIGAVVIFGGHAILPDKFLLLRRRERESVPALGGR
jgi:hypothetical protein